jgi:hypothetical protein
LPFCLGTTTGKPSKTFFQTHFNKPIKLHIYNKFIEIIVPNHCSE